MSTRDYDKLINALLPFAQQMLAKQGGFLPFGASVKLDGEVRMEAVHPNRPPDAQELIDLLIEALRLQRRNKAIRAAGLCFDSRLVPPDATEKSDAIAIRAERKGEAVVIYLPYRQAEPGRYEYGEVFATPTEPRIFRRRRVNDER